MQLLAQLFDSLISRFEGVALRAEPRHVIREAQRIHSVAMFELVRQVAVQCVERGVLLKRVWEYVTLHYCRAADPAMSTGMVSGVWRGDSLSA